MDGWVWVLDSIAQFARVLTYNRAGIGASDPAPTPRSSKEVVADVRALLDRASIPGPYVLVAQSYGIYYVHLFAHQHRDEVVGMALVDVLPPEMVPRQLEQLPPEEPGEDPKITETRKGLKQMILDEVDEHLPGMSDNPERIDNRATWRQWRAGGPLEDLPLIVLSAGRPIDALWGEMQHDLLPLSSRSRQIVAFDSGHSVEFDQPEVVVNAIRDLVETIRGGGV
jgi:pimeloyl-ACP methyl ester carboxylesterase